MAFKRKKLFITWQEDIKIPYGYVYPVSYWVKYYVKFFTVNNFKKNPYDSLFWSVRREIRKADWFGYWSAFRRREENRPR